LDLIVTKLPRQNPHIDIRMSGVLQERFEECRKKHESLTIHAQMTLPSTISLAMKEQEHKVFDNVMFVIALPRNCTKFSTRERLYVNGRLATAKSLMDNLGEGPGKTLCQLHLVAKLSDTVKREELFWNLWYQYECNRRVALTVFAKYETWEHMARMSNKVENVTDWLRSMGILSSKRQNIAARLASMRVGFVKIKTVHAMVYRRHESNLTMVKDTPNSEDENDPFDTFASHYGNVKQQKNKPKIY